MAGNVLARSPRQESVSVETRRISSSYDEPPDNSRPTLAIVVPTRHESRNIQALVDRVSAAVTSASFELIFVDDSDDDTPDVIRRVSSNSTARVRLIHRQAHERLGGLGGAVIAGFRATSAKWICVMDGDLQHPPELVEKLLKLAEADDKDLVLASRYADGGGTQGLGAIRTAISVSLLKMAQFIFPRQLRGVTDPLTGFFIVRRNAVDVDALRPSGFKILLEILVRSEGLRVAEIPFTIQDRFEGESKASAQEVQRYIRLLTRLRLEKSTSLMKFAAVGASGLVVNTAALALFSGAGGINYLIAAVLATQVSTSWNFILTEGWVFGQRKSSRRLTTRLGGFFLVNELALLIRGPALYVLVDLAGLNYLVANVLTLVGFMLVRFVIADGWLWAEARIREYVVHLYDIHGIISVSSEVDLPELAEFRTEKLDGQPQIEVRRMKGAVQPKPETPVAGVLNYREAVGGMGFAVDVDQRQPQSIKVDASAWLCRSPHVLYTNVVEPILRWSFAEKGYALIHGACISDGPDGILVTARTDTGKTTTVLKTLENYPVAFLSDDLTLMKEDGSLLKYPKPMTISRHTLHAVKTPLLSPWERAALFVQSRVHSRSGRKFAHFLVKTGVPVATINLFAQYVIPPPKYSVRRLVPSVLMGEQARLSALIVIERGEPSVRQLDCEESFALLMSNTEDAYGFPPYHQIEGFLRDRNGVDLRAREAAIVRSAVETIGSGTAVSSSSYDWWRHLPIQSKDGVDRSSARGQVAAQTQGQI